MIDVFSFHTFGRVTKHTKSIIKSFSVYLVQDRSNLLSFKVNFTVASCLVAVKKSLLINNY